MTTFFIKTISQTTDRLTWRAATLGMLIVFLFACGSHNTTTTADKDTSSTIDYLLQDSSISRLLAANHQKLTGVKGDFKSFRIYISKLNDDSLSSIPFALDYINSCISTDNPERDSVFFLFNEIFYSVTNKLSDSLETKYGFLMEELARDSNTVELRAFENNLAACGIGVFSTEGMYYLDVVPDFFYNNFKNRVSEGVAEYLTIRKDELKQGFSEDAGLLISFEDLSHRVKRWENFIAKYPNTVYSGEANSYYATYLETLMAGMDNSRPFDLDNNSLLPDIKKLYEKIIKEKPESQTGKIISSYYNFLARHNFKDNDSVQLFLKAYNLSTMLAVQPHTR